MSVTLRQAERAIDDSGVVAIIEGLIEARQRRPGRRRELPVRALLIGQLLTAQTGRSHLVRVVETLNALPPATRKRLGIYREGGITYRQVERLNTIIARAIDRPEAATMDERLVDFDDICSRIVFFSAHPEARRTPSIALDATDIPTWGTNRRRKRNARGQMHTPRRTYRVEGNQVFTDPDAGVRGAWKAKKGDPARPARRRNAASPAVPGKAPLYGYEMTTATTVRELYGDPVPFATTAMRFRPAVKDTVAMGLAVVFDHARLSGVIGDVIFDRGYNHAHDGSDFIMPLRALGAEPVFQLQPNQIGTAGTVRGALIIDGQPFSISTPDIHKEIVQPHIKSDAAVIGAYQDRVAQRAPYAMAPHGSRQPSGAQVYECPASAGKLICHLVAASLALPVGTMPAFNAPLVAAFDSVCTRKYTTFQAADLPLSQRELYGSKEWFDSMNRRNPVEGFYGNLKDQARENFRRGGSRLMTIVKSGLLAAVNVASVNLRMAAKWDAEHGATHRVYRPRRGRPRNEGVSRHLEVFERVAALARPPD